MEITWNSRCDTGIRVLEEQHQELFGIVDRLRRVIEEGAARNTVETLLGDLLACSERHFAAEETYMSRFSYPVSLSIWPNTPCCSPASRNCRPDSRKATSQ